ncbi:MAG: DoxX family protein [Actinomycetia bacterium]|nr:DoxX family protein [Actinomycetes bacterium]
MHKLIVIVSRMFLAPIFILSGQRNLRNPGPQAVKAAKVVPEPVSLHAVRANGAFMVVAGTAMALGIKPRLAALGLAGALIPTTLAGHAFWDDEPGPNRSTNQLQVAKNLGLIGGLFLVAADSGPHKKHRRNKA